MKGKDKRRHYGRPKNNEERRRKHEGGVQSEELRLRG